LLLRGSRHKPCRNGFSSLPASERRSWGVEPVPVASRAPLLSKWPRPRQRGVKECSIQVVGRTESESWGGSLPCRVACWVACSCRGTRGSPEPTGAPGEGRPSPCPRLALRGVGEAACWSHREEDPTDGCHRGNPHG
jgi:hypothetical protein